MRTRRWLLVGSGLLCVAGSLLCAGAGWAGKPGGGGSVPAGTIYFASNGTWSMAADGRAKTQLPSGLAGGLPSHQAHGGGRWFLVWQPAGGTNPDGTAHAELFAVGQDGLTSVQLTNASTLAIEWTRWAKDDSFFSFSAVDWSVPSAPTSCLLLVPLAWDGNGNPYVSGLPTYAVTIPGASTPIGNGQVSGFVSSHDWSPTGDRVVWSDNSTGTRVLMVTTLASGSTTTLTGGANPAWSPDGSKIAFGTGEIWLIAPNGAGLQRVLRGGPRFSVVRPEWSPTGSHIAYMRDDWSVFPRELDIYRATASGSGATNLTPEAGDLGAGPILGWR